MEGDVRGGGVGMSMRFGEGEDSCLSWLELLTRDSFTVCEAVKHPWRPLFSNNDDEKKE